jgi:hypothetical protein
MQLGLVLRGGTASLADLLFVGVVLTAFLGVAIQAISMRSSQIYVWFSGYLIVLTGTGRIEWGSDSISYESCPRVVIAGRSQQIPSRTGIENGIAAELRSRSRGVCARSG